jgi:hypothetical protein
MLKIAKLNGETSNNSISLIAIALAINIARLVATTLAILVAATPFKLIALIILIIVTPLSIMLIKL